MGRIIGIIAMNGTAVHTNSNQNNKSIIQMPRHAMDMRLLHTWCKYEVLL